MIYTKTIEGFPNYTIDTIGRVYSKYKKAYLKQYNDKDGYYYVKLYNKGKKKTIKSHRLVCIAFLPNFYNKPMVDHKNKLKSDNRLINLHWATAHENQQNVDMRKDNTSGHMNIRNHNNMWQFAKQFDGKVHRETFKTLEEAIIYRDNFLLNLDKNTPVIKRIVAKSGHKYIEKTKFNTWNFKKKKYSKCFKTLEEAIIYRDRFLLLEISS